MPEAAPAPAGPPRGRTLRLALVIALWPTLVAAVALAVTFAHRNKLVAAAAWGATILLSWTGWGWMLVRRLLPGQEPHWALRGALGMCATLVAGGALCLVQAARPGVLVALTVAGIVGGAVERYRFFAPGRPHGQMQGQMLGPVSPAASGTAGAAPAPRPFGDVLAVARALLWGMLLVFALGAVADLQQNPWDDGIAYVGFARQILGSGTLIEPFSLRRISALGGQSFLHAIQLSGSSMWRLHAVDGALGLLLSAGLVASWPVPAKRRALAGFFGLLLLASIALRPHNIGSELTGLVCFLTLMRLLQAMVEDGPTRRGGLALALVLAGTITLRQNYIAPAVAIPGAVLAAVLLATPRRHWPGWLRHAGLVFGVTLALVAPWLVLAQLSSGTFLYPLLHGNARSGFGLLGHTTAQEEARFLLRQLLHDWPLRWGWAFIVAALLLRERRPARLNLAVLAGVGVGAFALAHAFAIGDDVQSVSRYYFGFVLAAALYFTLQALADHPWRPAAIVVMAAILGQVVVGKADARKYFGDCVAAIRSGLKGAPEPKAYENDRYRRLQAAVPAGEPLLVMLDQPFRLDFRRNRIVNLDQPSGVSPPPGLPQGRGPEALLSYFRGLGYRYIAFRISDRSPEYSVAKWTRHAREPYPKPRTGTSRGDQLHDMAPAYLDFFQNLTRLAQTQRRLFDEEDYLVLDLAESLPS